MPATPLLVAPQYERPMQIDRSRDGNRSRTDEDLGSDVRHIEVDAKFFINISGLFARYQCSSIRCLKASSQFQRVELAKVAMGEGLP